MNEWCEKLATIIGDGNVVHVPGIDERKATTIKNRLKFLKCHVKFEPAFHTTNCTHIVNEFGEIIGIEPGRRVLSGYTFKLKEDNAQSAS